ncbi:MAG TPA: zinc ribbon domain-containing protein [Blastocatellia bacterium]|nr:zinc ribbon domain-containing protein [Blastocatellia bacterium]
MYCSECGAQSTEGLKYCKRCGAGLGALAKQVFTPPRVTGVFWAVALVTIGGLGILMGTVIALVAIGMRDEDVVVPVSMGGFLTLLAIAWMLIRQMSRIVDASSGKSEADKRPVSAFQRRKPAQIAGPPSAVPSVTENTTRSFDSVRHRPATEDEGLDED